jgi:hypothetical protein
MTAQEIQKAVELCKKLGLPIPTEHKAKRKGKVHTKYVQILERDGYKFITYDSRTQDKDVCKRAKKACTLKAKMIRQYYSKNW